MIIQRSLTALFIVILPVQSHASVMRFTFTGEVSVVYGNAFSLGARVGDKLAGAFSYDTDVADEAADPDVGSYTQHLTDGFTLLVGGRNVATLPYNVNVANNNILPSQDELSISDVPELGIAGYKPALIMIDGAGGLPGEMRLKFTDPSKTAFSDASLPSSIDLSMFSNASGTLYQATGNPFDLQGFGYTVNSIVEVPSVPEPSTYLLWCLGVAAAFGHKVVGHGRKSRPAN